MLPTIQHYEPPNQSLWQGRQDSLPGERFFQQVKLIDIRSQSLPEKGIETVIIGFSCDEGIRRNEGRPGAKDGPIELRRQFAKLAATCDRQLIDLGDIVCSGQQLEEAQEQLAVVIHYCHLLGYKTIALGGGHEIAWGHFSGLAPHYPKLGIINFDAHFDLRTISADKKASSGTPFWQIARYYQQHHQSFNYCCLGIQTVANTRSLFTTANKYKVSYLTASQINQSSFGWQTAFIDDFILNHQAIYLSICMDVFAESYAPGVSAPQALGLTPWQVLPLLKYIMQTGKVISIDLAELSPPLDQGLKTSRLAASVMAELLEFN